MVTLALVKFIVQSRVGLVPTSEPVAQVVDFGLMAALSSARGVESFAQLRALSW
jgi:hypothetical protein